LNAIRVSIVGLQNVAATAQGQGGVGAGPAGGPPAFLWGLGFISLGAVGQGAVPGATPGPPDASASGTSGLVSVALQDLKDRVKSIKDQLQAKTVAIGGVVLKSQSLTKAWLGVNGPAAGAYIYFLDAHALLSLAADEACSARSVINFQHSAAKGDTDLRRKP
jgi:hypothetical protein